MSDRYLSKWSLAWCSWIFLFSEIEKRAMRSGDANATLSSHLRWLFGYGKKPNVVTFPRQLVGMALWGWVISHLLSSPSKRGQESHDGRDRT